MPPFALPNASIKAFNFTSSGASAIINRFTISWFFLPFTDFSSFNNASICLPSFKIFESWFNNDTISLPTPRPTKPALIKSPIICLAFHRLFLPVPELVLVVDEVFVVVDEPVVDESLWIWVLPSSSTRISLLFVIVVLLSTVVLLFIVFVTISFVAKPKPRIFVIGPAKNAPTPAPIPVRMPTNFLFFWASTLFARTKSFMSPSFTPSSFAKAFVSFKSALSPPYPAINWATVWDTSLLIEPSALNIEMPCFLNDSSNFFAASRAPGFI